MNGRQKMEQILRRCPTTPLTWTALVDDHTLKRADPGLRGRWGLDFYRSIGCDVFLLNQWIAPFPLESPVLNWGEGVRIEWSEEHGRQVGRWRTPRGTLTALYENGHPLKYPVESLEDLKLYRSLWDTARYEARDDRKNWDRLEREVGTDGVVTRFWGPTTIPRLLENDMGVVQFYYFMNDYPDLMKDLIAAMHQRELEAFDHLAAGPWPSVTLCENTSTYYISPRIYADYNMPHQRDFVGRMHAAGKTAILHMCGHVMNLLPLIRETGCDGIHTLTPPPTGDTPWEAALDAMGDDLIIMGALDPTIFAAGPIEEIGPALSRLITPRLRKSPFVLCLMADGIPIEEARFRAVTRWMEANG